MRCVTGKRMYPTKEIAEEVLLDAWTRYDYSAGNGPVAVYQCQDCGAFHLTKSGEMNPTLLRHIEDGRIRLRKEAEHWMRKLK